MSDLAPFVAAALRDHTVAELTDEIASLKERFAQTQEIQVRIGDRVFAKGKLNQGRHLVFEVSVYWRVDLQHRADFPLARIWDLEIYVGGMAVADTLKQCRNSTVRNAYNRDSKMGEFLIPNDVSSVLGQVYVRIGPFASFEDYLLQTQHHFLPDLERLGRDNPQMKVSVDGILFHPSQMRGKLDNLGVARLTASQLAAEQRRAAQHYLSRISGGQLADHVADNLCRQANVLLAFAAEAEQHGNDDEENGGADSGAD